MTVDHHLDETELADIGQRIWQEYLRLPCREFKLILSRILRRATAVLSIKANLNYISAHLTGINDVDSDLVVF
jgi:hypothetical protein